ncbi:MAG: YbgC/FadM family acyl-CoA thioesterase [Polyangiales bacterium]
MLSRDGYRTLHRLRVRWADVDPQAIVFNGHYLTYLDDAVTAHYRGLGLPYDESLELLDGEFFVKKTTLEYHAPARFDDSIEVGLRTARFGRTSLVYEACAFLGEKPLVSFEMVCVFADRETRRPIPIDERMRSIWLDYEAGAPMLETRIGDFAELGAAARALREAVFVREQGIAPELEWDDADERARHVVIENRLGRPLATGRLGPDGRLGRMAVHRSLRGEGLGRRVLESLLDEARSQGLAEVVLHAQRTAIPFYERAGFERTSDVFVEAGIPHVTMRRRLEHAGAGRAR